MTILQQASGTWTGTSFTPALPAASTVGNRIVVIVAANTTVTTPAGWALRTSQVNFMGHYLFDLDADGSTGTVFTSAAGQGTWWIVEVVGGNYDTAVSANDSASGTTYATPSITPAGGPRTLLASLASLSATTAVRTVSGWTNSFVEQIDVCQASVDYPMQAGANLDVTATGASYATTGTYSLASTGRSAIIASYRSGVLVQDEGTKNASAMRAMTGGRF